MTDVDALVEFLNARIADDKREARAAISGQADPENGWGVEGRAVTPHVGIIHEGVQRAHVAKWNPARVLAECEAKRRIVELHESWPVLVQQQPTFEPIDDADPSRLTIRASQQLAWLTEQEYRDRFGDEPPTAPMIRVLALMYADHPDWREEWRP